MLNPVNTPRASSTSTTHVVSTHGSSVPSNSNSLSVTLMSRLSPPEYKQSGLGRDYWLDDSSATKCRDCDRKFTTFLRKHHCRICGKIFCHNCTRFIDGDKFDHKGKMRVCFFCAKKAERYESYNSSDEDADETNYYDRTPNLKPLSPRHQKNGSMSKFTSPPPLPQLMSTTSRSSSFSSRNKGIVLNSSNKIDPLEMDMPKLRNEKVRSRANSTKNLSSLSMTQKFGSTSANSDSSNSESESDDKDYGYGVSGRSDHFAFDDKAPDIGARARARAGNDAGAHDHEEHGMIKLMNKHQFNWPLKGDATFVKKFDTINTNNNDFFQSGSGRDGLRVPPLNSKHLGNLGLGHGHGHGHGHSLRNISSSNSSSNTSVNRRRNFSSRYKNMRQPSKIQKSNLKSVQMIDLKSDIHFMDDLQRLSENYNKFLLKELMNDKQVENIDHWTEILLKSLRKVNNIEIELNKNREITYDFADYIKIKRIPGGSIEDSTTVEGLVFSKKIPLKTMPNKINNPKIMLITFAIEYDSQNINQNFQSLDGIIAQQDEYLKKLVSRIIQLKPNIILSNCSINGLALKQFSNNKILAVPNCKLNNMIKLSKFINSTIISSIDILATKPKLGSCELFEEKYYLHEKILKSYFYFSGCNSKIGLTFIIRGSKVESLNKIKNCLSPMIYAFVNSEFESSFLRDKYLKLVDNKEINKEISKPLYSIKLENFDDVVKLIDNRIISTSPWVKFNRPQILVQIQQTLNLIKDIEILFNQFLNDSDKVKHIEKYKDQFNLNLLEIKNEFDLIKIVKEHKNYFDNFWNSELLFYYKKWSQFWSSRDFTFFDPNYNQNIVVLFSMISNKNSTPCIEPELQIFDFYWESDESIGNYIEQICLQSEQICLNGCGLKLKDHFRSYVHNEGKIDINLEMNNLEGVKTMSIVTWSTCKKCLKSTNHMPLSDSSFKYSFGKFLQLVFWYDNSLLKCSNSNCQCMRNEEGQIDFNFDFFKDSIHYFSYSNFIVKFEYSKIDSLQLITPKFKLFWDPNYDFKIKWDYFNYVKNKSNLFFNSVDSRLMLIKLDGTYLNNNEMDDSYILKGEEKLSELKEKLKIQKKEIMILIDTVYKNSKVNEHLKLNIVLREVQELSSFWKFEFDDFENKFLPTVNEIKSNFQVEKLLNLLVNKANEGNQSDENEHEHEHEKEHRGESDDGTGKNIGKADKVRPHKSSLILNKINQLNKHNPGIDQEEILTSQPHVDNLSSYSELNKLGRLDSGQVKRLTKLFETDTLDYFNKREELEKKKLHRANYTPRVGTMKPYVEIYNDSKDVSSQIETKSHTNGSIVSSNIQNLNLNNSMSASTDWTEGKEDESILASSVPIPAVKNENNSNKDVVEKEEKNWFFKIMTNFLDARSSTSWKDLSYPLGSTEHIFVDSDVIVREDEPSSIIAFCLSTKDYESKLYNNNTEEKNGMGGLFNLSTLASSMSTMNVSEMLSNGGGKEVESECNNEQSQKGAVYDDNSSIGSVVSDDEGNKEKSLGQTSQEKDYKDKDKDRIQTIDKEIKELAQEGNGNTNVNASANANEPSNDNYLKEILLKNGFHLKYQFEGGNSTSIIMCKIFFAEQFDALRRKCGVNENFIGSLSRCVKWDSTGGKSGAAFLKTLDDRFIIKELSKAEMEAFLLMSHNYFEYFEQVLFNDLPSVLVKIFGFYQIQVKSNHKSYTMDVVIMENLFYNKKPDRIFDLKGSMRNRHVEQTGKANEVLLDENMVEYIYESPVFIKENDKRLLRASLWNDTLFLEKMNVMDYSLVVGIDSGNNELVVGIIDCIRTFTWDKKLESWVKEKGLVGGGGGVGKEPTVITPKQYKNRFREAMERYILMAPGVYYQGTKLKSG